MKKQDLINKLKELRPWYQNINIEGFVTTKGGRYASMGNSEVTWKKILKFLDSNLEGQRILDLGCNAGFYSIMAANSGAEVVGIEYNKTFFKQALFLKDYYEKLWNKKLNILYMNKDISTVDFSNFGKFDCIFALSILYHIGKLKYGKGTNRTIKEQNRVILTLSKTTNKFVVRARIGKNKNTEYYNTVFGALGFTPTKVVPEGKRTLILYEK